MGSPDTIQSLKIQLAADVKPLQTLNKWITSTKNALAALDLTGKEATKNYGHFQQRMQSLTSIKTELTAKTKAWTGVLQSGASKVKIFSEATAKLYVGLGLVATGFKNAFEKQKTFISQGLKGETLKENFAGTAEELEKIKKASGNLIEDTRLMELINLASSLNNNIEQQEKLWQASRLIAQKTGRDVGEVFNGLIKAEEGMVRGLVLSGISRINYNQEVAKTVKLLGGETEEIIDANGEKEVTIKNLDAESQTRVRQQAIISVLTNKFGDLSKVETTNYEKTLQLTASIKDSREEMGALAGKELIKLSEGLIGAGADSLKLAGHLGGLGSALADLGPIIIGLKLAFGASFGTMLTYLVAVVTQVYIVIESIKNVGKAFTFVQDIIEAGSWNDVTKSLEKLGGKKKDEFDFTEPDTPALDAWEQKKVDNENKKLTLIKTQNKEKKEGGQSGRKIQKETTDLLGEELLKISEIIELSKLRGQLSKDILETELQAVTGLDVEGLTSKDQIRILNQIKSIKDEIKNIDDKQREKTIKELVEINDIEKDRLKLVKERIDAEIKSLEYIREVTLALMLDKTIPDKYAKLIAEAKYEYEKRLKEIEEGKSGPDIKKKESEYAEMEYKKKLGDLKTEQDNETLATASTIKDEFFQMLQITGLMEGSFGEMLSMINSAISFLSSASSIFSAIASFIPGGGLLGLGGMPSGMPANNSQYQNNKVMPTPNIQIFTKSEIEESKYFEVWWQGQKIAQGRPGDYNV